MKLLLYLSIATLLATLAGDSHAKTVAQSPKLEARSSDSSVIEYALEQLNTLRASKGLKPLCLNKALQDSAQAHSDWMARTSQPKHANTLQRVESYGYPSNTYKAENIAVNMNGNADANCFGYAPRVQDVYTSAAYATNCAWYNSKSGHFENMLSPDFNQVGIAYAIGNYMGRSGYYWTQNFGRSAQPCIGTNSYYGARKPVPKPAPSPSQAPKRPAPTTVPAPASRKPTTVSVKVPLSSQSPKVVQPNATKTSEAVRQTNTVVPVKTRKIRKCKPKKAPATTNVYGDAGGNKTRAVAKPTSTANGHLHAGAPASVSTVPTPIAAGKIQAMQEEKEQDSRDHGDSFY